MPQPGVNIYCDESGHLEFGVSPIMVLGALWHDSAASQSVAKDLRQIKENHGLPSGTEAKWTKISPSKMEYYLDLVRYYFESEQLHFKAIIVEKAILDHESWGQSHDDFYYKMYFTLLKSLIDPRGPNCIYLDIKDTRSSRKAQKLWEILATNAYDFDRSVVKRVQHVRSEEVEQIQLVDILIGAVQYANREVYSSPAKSRLVELVQQLSGKDLHRTTLLKEHKMNILRWRPRDSNGL